MVKIEIPLKDAKFIMTRGEINYEEVLDDFRNAEYIDIVTFNISQNSNILLNELKKLRKGVRVNIITNIPNRWESYWAFDSRARANNTIKIYTLQLNPHSYPCLVHTMFDFHNHGKLILTNNVAYWGSANYSDESVNNTEFGTITRDTDFIRRIHDEILHIVKNESEPYYKSPYAQKYYDLIIMKNEIIKLQCEYETFIYDYYDYHNYEKKVFKEHVESMSVKFIDAYFGNLNDIKEVCDELYMVLNKMYDDDEFVDDYYQLYESLLEKMDLIHQILSDTKVTDIVEYNTSDEACYILQEKYYQEAYDEYLDHYAMKASDEAYERLAQLTLEAKPTLLHVEEIMDDINHVVQGLIEKVSQSRIMEINCRINNTKEN